MNAAKIRDEFVVAKAEHMQLTVQIDRSTQELAKAARLTQEREPLASFQKTRIEELEKNQRGRLQA